MLTHIHLDHAGGVGSLAGRFPNATVWVHERGARHLADPSRLVSSATRVYGEERMASLFGPVEPVPAERLRVLGDDEELDIGGRSLTALDTPGHASHHLALVDSSTGVVFTGDALGIHVPIFPSCARRRLRPGFDLELAVASIERIRAAALSCCSRISDRSPTSTARASSRSAGCTSGPMRCASDAIDRISTRSSRSVPRGGRETVTGAEAQLDLDRLETLAGVRMNAMGIADT